jgi:hypothetical protein
MRCCVSTSLVWRGASPSTRLHNRTPLTLLLQSRRYFFQVSTRSLQGIFNAVTYGFNQHVTTEWLALLSQCPCANARPRDIEESGGGADARKPMLPEDEDEDDARAEGIDIPGADTSSTQGSTSEEGEGEQGEPVISRSLI